MQPSPLHARVVDAFLAGRLRRFSHARHVAVANILRHLPHGKELMHLGLQVTATRAGVPGKYSREITDAWWEKLDGALPDDRLLEEMLADECAVEC